MREPLDTNQHRPTVLGRDEAAQRLLSLVPADVADQVWDELIAPLYDARQMALHWQRGQCRYCGAPHPESEWAKTRRRIGHQMHCRLYVGPLTHARQGSHPGALGNGFRVRCSCGKTYEDDLWADPRPECPDKDVDWRGPRPTSG